MARSEAEAFQSSRHGLGEVPVPNFLDAAQLAFWLPLLSDQLSRSGYTPSYWQVGALDSKT